MLLRYLLITLLVFSGIALPHVVEAGQLFPPNGLPLGANGQPDPTQSCPNNGVLAWDGQHGSVTCADPTKGINLTLCPTGQTLQGINNNGTPVCVPPPSGTLCGMVFWETHSEVMTNNIQNNAACMGTVLMDGGGGTHCPTGYTFTNVHYNWGDNGGTMFEYHTGSCAAN